MMREERKRRTLSVYIFLMATLFLSTTNVYAEDMKVKKSMRNEMEKVYNGDEIEEEFVPIEFTNKVEDGIQTYVNDQEPEKSEEQIDTRDMPSISQEYDELSIKDFLWNITGIMDDKDEICLRGAENMAEEIKKEHSVIDEALRNIFRVDDPEGEDVEDKREKRDQDKEPNDTYTMDMPKRTDFGGDERSFRAKTSIRKIHINFSLGEDVVSYSVQKQKRCIKRYQTMF